MRWEKKKDKSHGTVRVTDAMREAYGPLALFPIYSFIYKIYEELAMEKALCQVLVILSFLLSYFYVLVGVEGRQ